MDLSETAIDILSKGWNRFLEMMLVPLDDPEIIWAAAPLIIALVFMTFYFGRYKGEELGWNTAFGNTMVFIFMAINLIKKMYFDTGIGTIDGILDNPLYLLLSIGLILAGFLLMFITYFRLIPKELAFFMFSTPPLNVTIYVITTMIYSDVPADLITLVAALILLVIILVVTTILKNLVYVFLGEKDSEDVVPEVGDVPKTEDMPKAEDVSEESEKKPPKKEKKAPKKERA
jgi:hypothetical protein